MSYIAHERQQSEEGPFHDIHGVRIELGDRVAYGDWGNVVYTGRVKRIAPNHIDLTRDNYPAWERRVYSYNSDRMIVVINRELLNQE